MSIRNGVVSTKIENYMQLSLLVDGRLSFLNNVFTTSGYFALDDDILCTENCKLLAKQRYPERTPSTTIAWAMGPYFKTVCAWSCVINLFILNIIFVFFTFCYISLSEYKLQVSVWFIIEIFRNKVIISVSPHQVNSRINVHLYGDISLQKDQSRINTDELTVRVSWYYTMIYYCLASP